MITIKLTPKNSKPGFFMNLEVNAQTFDEVTSAVKSEQFIEGQRLHIQKENDGMLRVTSRSPAMISTTEIAFVQLADREFAETAA